MYLNVSFTPSAIIAHESRTNDIYIVIDVIRATTTLAVVFDRRAARVLVAETVEQAREAAQKHPGSLLCGERNVQPLPGFDYGNSPVQFSQLDLTGRELILTTTNGTRAFYACPEGSTCLAGSFYNAEAVTARALALAAIALYEAFKPPKVIDYSDSAQSVIRGGLPDDPPFCMLTSMSQSVPLVVGKDSETGLLALEQFKNTSTQFSSSS